MIGESAVKNKPRKNHLKKPEKVTRAEKRQTWTDAISRSEERQQERFEEHKKTMKRARENYERTFRK